MSIYVCYCLLKRSPGSRDFTHRLRKLQEKYEVAGAPDLPRQAFVYGDGEAACTPFRTYPKGWRVGADESMDGSRQQDMLALSWRLLESAMRRQPEAEFKLVILADGPAGEEEESAACIKDQLQELQRKGLEIIYEA